MARLTKPVISWKALDLTVEIMPVTGAESFSVWARHKSGICYFESTDLPAIKDKPTAAPLSVITRTTDPIPGTYDLTGMATSTNANDDPSEESTITIELSAEEIKKLLSTPPSPIPAPAPAPSDPPAKDEPPASVTLDRVKNIAIVAPATFLWPAVASAIKYPFSISDAATCEQIGSESEADKPSLDLSMFMSSTFRENVTYVLKIRAAGGGSSASDDCQFAFHREGARLLPGQAPNRPQPKADPVNPDLASLKEQLAKLEKLVREWKPGLTADATGEIAKKQIEAEAAKIRREIQEGLAGKASSTELHDTEVRLAGLINRIPTPGAPPQAPAVAVSPWHNHAGLIAIAVVALGLALILAPSWGKVGVIQVPSSDGAPTLTNEHDKQFHEMQRMTEQALTSANDTKVENILLKRDLEAAKAAAVVPEVKPEVEIDLTNDSHIKLARQPTIMGNGNNIVMGNQTIKVECCAPPAPTPCAVPASPPAPEQSMSYAYPDQRSYEPSYYEYSYPLYVSPYWWQGGWSGSGWDWKQHRDWDRHIGSPDRDRLEHERFWREHRQAPRDFRPAPVQRPPARSPGGGQRGSSGRRPG
jgi:hypothetical protein